MIHPRRLVVILAIGMGLARVASPAIAEAPPEADLARIRELEQTLFHGPLTAARVDELLKQLDDRGTRDESARLLSEHGHPFVAKIIEHARNPDIEIRQSCADIVAAIDGSYRRTVIGRELGDLHRKHAAALWPDYWRRFRKDPLDHAAVAMLMSVDAEAALTFAKTGKDPQNELRYLLLRIRESAGDEFAAARIAAFGNVAIRAALADVFPIAAENPKTIHCRRVVGHVVHDLAVPYTPSADPPGEGGIGLRHVKQAIYLFYPTYKNFPKHVRDPEGLYMQSQSYFTPPLKGSTPDQTTTRGNLFRFADLYGLPTLALDQYQMDSWRRATTPYPWWIKDRLPQHVAAKLEFRPRTFGQESPPQIDGPQPTVPVLTPYAGPRVAAPRDAPSVVVLPPRTPANASPATVAAAEAACDRLAQEIAAEGRLQVVDRTQLMRVLEERKLAANPEQPPIVGYAAMIRLEVTSNGDHARTRIAVIELATGNSLGEREFTWPLREADVAPAKELCRRAASEAATVAADKRKVRLLKVHDTNEQVRLKPLAYRLHATFRESLAQSERVLLVQHMEAGSSWEESLLLLMGLARLPGGKQFAPQADATVELRIEERDGLGKTFEETPIVVGVGVQQGANPDTVWTEASGKVRDFDRVAVEAWGKFAERLDGVAPGTAREVVLEMSVRRKQAEAELRAARNASPAGSTGRDAAQIQSAIAHAEAALKIDPTFAEAHFELALHLEALCAHLVVSSRSPTRWDELPPVVRKQLEIGATYASHPESESAKRCKVLRHSLLAVNWSPLKPMFEKRQPALSEEGRRLLEPLKTIVEKALDGPVKDADPAAAHLGMLVVHRTMQTIDIPAAERTAWIDGMLQQVDVLEKSIGEARAFSREFVLSDLRRIRTTAAQLASEDGNSGRVRALVEAAREGLTPKDPALQSRVADIDRVLEQSGDSTVRQEFRRSTESLAQEVYLLHIKWPAADGSIPRLPAPASPAISDGPAMRIVRPRETFRQVPAAITPIAVDDKRVFVLLSEGKGSLVAPRASSAGNSSTSVTLAMIPLDAQGRPTGKLVDVPIEGRSRPAQEWDGFVFPKQRQVPGGGVHVAQVRHGKLFLGTQGGLNIYDPVRDAWRRIGAEQGLPTRNVSGFFFLADDRLYCAGIEQKRGAPGIVKTRQANFTLDLGTSEVKLLHYWDRNDGRAASRRFKPVWWNDGILVDGWQTDLLSGDPRLRPGGGEQPLANALTATELEDRRFLTTNEGLLEYDVAGKVQRRWQTVQETTVPFHRSLRIPRIGNAPPHGRLLIKSGDLLMLVDPESGVTAFDPRTDTWYGPLVGPGVVYAIGSDSGIWLSYVIDTLDKGAAYFDRAEFLKAARDAGRVTPTSEPAALLRKVASRHPPLERAKVQFVIRDFDACGESLRKVLEADPQHAEALFLMGLLHDRWGRNKPEAALPWYERLAALEDRSASATGMVYALAIHHGAGRWTEVREIGDRIEARFPTLEPFVGHYVDAWRKDARKRLANAPESPFP
ncbi:MAG: hypothetical protein WD069_22915 [Planctomycetales bacterium]